MSHHLRQTPVAVSAAVTLALTVGLAVHAPAANADPSTFCGLSGFAASDTYIWTGDAGDGRWQTGANWDVNGMTAMHPPGKPRDLGGPQNLDSQNRNTDYVCIGLDSLGNPADVTLGGPYTQGGENIVGPAIATLDLGQGADLTVTGNSKLWLNRRQSANQPSRVRNGSSLDLEGATLGGRGTLDVDGILDAQSLDYSQQNKFVVTITTRWCDVGNHCQAATTTPGHINISANGVFRVDGPPSDTPPIQTDPAGINLEDGRVINNSGTIVIANRGYIAADHGTKINNNAGGTLNIQNDYGIYEGRNHFHNARPALSNSGTVEKSAGTGTSVIGTSYTGPSSAIVVVASGTLTLNRSSTTAGATVPAATVAAGASYGLGSCPESSVSSATSCPNGTVGPGHPQAALVSLASTAGASTVQVTTQTTNLPSGHLGQAVQFETPGSTPVATDPNKFTLVYDASLLPPNTSQVTMKRANDGSSSFLTIPNCQSGGTIPSGQQSCVASETVVGSTGDLTVVINTTQNSRWVAT